MKNDQFTFEFRYITARQPSSRTDLFLWCFWICSVLLGSLFIMILAANMLNGILTDNLLRFFLDRRHIHLVSAEGRRWLMYLVSGVCMAIALHSLSIAWLIQLVLQRNTHIRLQNEFMEKMLEEHRQLELVSAVLKDDLRRLS